MDLAGGVASSNHRFLTLTSFVDLARTTSSGSFLVQGLDLENQYVDFFRGKFAGVFGHPALAVSDNAAEVAGGGDFVGDQRRSAEVAAFCGLAVTLRTVLLEDSVLGQGPVRRRGLAEACSECEDQ